MIYILISIISACAGAIIFGLLLAAKRNVKENNLFKKYEYLFFELPEYKTDAEIAYLETLYGLDNQKRESRGR